MKAKIDNPIGILGGTFDPIHNGHLLIATSLSDQTPIKTIKFMPCYLPVHRSEPEASPQERIDMINLGIASHPTFSIDTREIERKNPSYMIDSLVSLRNDYPHNPICLILGFDAYLNITTWKEWFKFLDYAHLIVVNRSFLIGGDDFEFGIHPDAMFAKAHTLELSHLTKNLSGYVFFFEIPECPIAATLIRERLNKKEEINSLVPPLVAEYIKKKGLYR